MAQAPDLAALKALLDLLRAEGVVQYRAPNGTEVVLGPKPSTSSGVSEVTQSEVPAPEPRNVIEAAMPGVRFIAGGAR